MDTIGILCAQGAKTPFLRALPRQLRALPANEPLSVRVFSLPELHMEEHMIGGVLVTGEGVRAAWSSLPAVIFNTAVQHRRSSIRTLRALLELPDCRVLNPSNRFDQRQVREMLVGDPTLAQAVPPEAGDTPLESLPAFVRRPIFGSRVDHIVCGRVVCNSRAGKEWELFNWGDAPVSRVSVEALSSAALSSADDKAADDRASTDTRLTGASPQLKSSHSFPARLLQTTRPQTMWSTRDPNIGRRTKAGSDSNGVSPASGGTACARVGSPTSISRTCRWSNRFDGLSTRQSGSSRSARKVRMEDRLCCTAVLKITAGSEDHAARTPSPVTSTPPIMCSSICSSGRENTRTDSGSFAGRARSCRGSARRNGVLAPWAHNIPIVSKSVTRLLISNSARGYSAPSSV